MVKGVICSVLCESNPYVGIESTFIIHIPHFSIDSYNHCNILRLHVEVDRDGFCCLALHQIWSLREMTMWPGIQMSQHEATMAQLPPSMTTSCNRHLRLILLRLDHKPRPKRKRTDGKEGGKVSEIQILDAIHLNLPRKQNVMMNLILLDYR